MPIQMVCPNIRCRHIHSFPDEARGQVIKCLKCQMQFRIPAPQKSTPLSKPNPMPKEFRVAPAPAL